MLLPAYAITIFGTSVPGRELAIVVAVIVVVIAIAWFLLRRRR